MANSRFGLRTRLGLVRSYTEGTIATDADADAFLDAAGITDTTIINAIRTLVVDLKLYGIWDKCKAIYPFVGGTATTHKFNLKDSRDLDAAFRLVFSGGWTHSTTGVLPNGTTGYADTKLNISSNLSLTDSHLAFYSRTNTANTSDFGTEIGLTGSYSFSAYLALRTRNTTQNGQQYYTIGSDNGATLSSTTGDGFFIGVSRSSTNRRIFRNASLSTSTSASNTGSLPNQTVIIGAGFTTSSFSSNECAFCSIGSNLTDTEISNYNTAVNTFQTTLGRQI